MTADRASTLRREAMEIYESGIDTHNALGLIAEATKIERGLGIEPQINPKEWAHLKPEPIEVVLNPEWVKAGPEADIEIHFHPDAVIRKPVPAQLVFSL